MRFVHMASIVGDVTGIGSTIKAIKYVYAGTKVMDVIVGTDAQTLLKPLLEALSLYGITGPTALARIYYLSCKHQLDSKLVGPQAIEDTIHGNFGGDSSTRAVSGVAVPNSTVEGLVATVGTAAAAAACKNEYMGPCPPSLLQFMSDYASVAQWLYLCSVPAPRNGNDWSSWYLSQLIKPRGWTLLMCINETTKLPNGVKVPAFCLVARYSYIHTIHLYTPMYPIYTYIHLYTPIYTYIHLGKARRWWWSGDRIPPWTGQLTSTSLQYL
jgi:hypothetical protein